MQSHYESLTTCLSEATVAPDAVTEFLDFFVKKKQDQFGFPCSRLQTLTLLT